MEEEDGGEVSPPPPPVAARSIIQMAPPATAAPHRPPPTATKSSPPAKKKRRFHCAVENCHYSTPYAKDLARHMRKHTGEKPFSCDQCSKSYSRYDKLICHLRTHEGLRLYKCSECSYAGIDSAALKKHQRTHTNERPYKCQLCPYAAKASTQLAVHLRSHTGDSPYFCTHGECDAAFKTLSDLQRHARLHTGEKPFACTEPGCSYKAAVKSNLNVHLRRHRSAEDKSNKRELVMEDLKSSESLVDDVRMNDDLSTVTVISDECANQSMNKDGSLESNVNDLELHRDQTFSSSVMTTDDQIDLTKQTQSTLNPLTKKSRLLSAQILEEPQMYSQSTQLPFQYACKICPYKADSLDIFETHMKSNHEGGSDAELPAPAVPTETANKLIRKTSNRTGRPRPARRTKPSGKNSSEELETYFDCPYCSASFVREDSLRCHLRQHSSSALPIPVAMNKRSIVHAAPTTSTVELSCIPPESMSLPFHQPLQVATTSVITQNPQSSSNADFTPSSPHRHVYIVSPGGSTIHPLNPHSTEETHFHIHE